MAAMQNKTTATTTMAILTVFFCCVFFIEAAGYTDGALFRENFESGTNNEYTFNGNGVTQTYTTGGIGGKILRTSYPPADNGSPRLVKRSELNKVVSDATLSFDMNLHSQFEFVKGGKLHGLGGGTGTTGCDKVNSNGWSVRMMWRTNGVPELYIYHQDRKDDCGDRFPATTGFRFGKATWYRIDIQVRMNSAVGSRNGYAALYIDGVLQAEAKNLNLSGNDSVKIDHFQFSTFYGGQSADWAPTKKTYAYFDNFTVMPGLIVSGAQGTKCEIFKEGIYSVGSQVCCSESCGSCGGSGCSGLSGGASKCCTGSISNTCSSSTSPCKFV